MLNRVLSLFGLAVLATLIAGVAVHGEEFVGGVETTHVDGGGGGASIPFCFHMGQVSGTSAYFGTSNYTIAASNASVTFNKAVTFSNLQCQCYDSPAGNPCNSWKFTLNVNGTDNTTLTCTTTTNYKCSDSTGSIALSAGDLVAVHAELQSGTLSVIASCCVDVS